MIISQLLNCTQDTIAFAERLNHVADLNAYPTEPSARAAEFANTLKISHAQAFAWLNGIYLPDSANIKRIAKRLKIDERWLKSGEGRAIAGKHPDSGLSSIPELNINQVLGDEFCYLNATKIAKKHFAAKIEDPENHCFSLFLSKKLLPVAFWDDSHVIINPSARLTDGSMVVAATEEQHLLCGYHVKAYGESYVVPFRDIENPYELSEDDHIVGVMSNIITLFR